MFSISQNLLIEYTGDTLDMKTFSNTFRISNNDTVNSQKYYTETCDEDYGHICESTFDYVNNNVLSFNVNSSSTFGVNNQTHPLPNNYDPLDFHFFSDYFTILLTDTSISQNDGHLSINYQILDFNYQNHEFDGNFTDTMILDFEGTFENLFIKMYQDQIFVLQLLNNNLYHNGQTIPMDFIVEEEDTSRGFLRYSSLNLFTLPLVILPLKRYFR